MRNSTPKIGDVFSVPLDEKSRRYFQCVAIDHTQLDSDVIRVFKSTYQIDAQPDLHEIVSGEIAFYTHVIVKLGIKMKLWEKVGSVPYQEKANVLFRHSWDFGKPGIKVSERWCVWRINEDFRNVGKLEGDFQKAEIGIVFAPPDIVERMRTGAGPSDFVDPGYPGY